MKIKTTIINNDEYTEKLKAEEFGTVKHNESLTPEETDIEPLKAYLKQPKIDADPLEAYLKQPKTDADPLEAYLKPPQTDLVPLKTELMPLKADVEPQDTDLDLLKTDEEPDLLIDAVDYEDQKLFLDGLIDMAFEAKSYGLFDESIKLFVQALDLKPPPDIAFYLIIDTYSMLDASTDKTSITQRLRKHCMQYKKDMPSEMKDIFEKWLTEENLF